MSFLAPASRDAHEADGHFTGSLLPDQLISRRDAETRSVRLLMTAIVRDAIDCFQKHLNDPTRRGRRLYREAETWLMSGQEASPLAFGQICDGIGLDPDYVRRHLSAWRAREMARAPHLPANVPRVWTLLPAPADPMSAGRRAARFTCRHPTGADRPAYVRRPA